MYFPDVDLDIVHFLPLHHRALRYVEWTDDFDFGPARLSATHLGAGQTVEPTNCTERNPPTPKVLGRDLPDGIRKRFQVYLGGAAFFRQNPVFLIVSDARLQKNIVKNSREDTCS